MAVDHVQLSIPPGGEDRARAFYVDVLGLTEVPKPERLAGRGGCWFEAGAVRLHVGVENDFHPARKAHPALTVRDLPGTVASLQLAIAWSDDVPGVVRGFVHDPFGNRIELVDVGAGPSGER